MLCIVMLTFILPRTNIRLYEDMIYTHKSKAEEKNVISKTRNIYIDNINKQLNNFKVDWNIMNHIYYPYEFIGDVMQNASQEQHFFSLRYAMHLELHHFIKHEILYTDNATKTLIFYGDDKYNLNNMSYLKNRDNENICIKYDSTNIKKILSKKSSSIDHIVIGTHSVDDNEDDYARISYISVLYALCFQKYNGSSLIKLFNIDTPLSIGIIGILSSMYLEVYLVKPITSKSDSTEIFVVCKKFLHKNSNLFYKNFMKIIHNLTKNEVLPQLRSYRNLNNNEDTSRSKIIASKIDYEYEILRRGAINLQLINKINEVSIIFYQRRLEYIHTIINTSFIQCKISPIRETVRLFCNFVKQNNFNLDAKSDEGISQLLQTQVYDNPKINAIINNNIHKCIEWTSKYHKPIIFSSEISIIVIRHLYDMISVLNI